MMQQAFKTARAAYARAYHDFGPPDYSAPTTAARIALDDAGIPRAAHWPLMVAVWACKRPGVERAIANAQACEDWS